MTVHDKTRLIGRLHFSSLFRASISLTADRVHEANQLLRLFAEFMALGFQPARIGHNGILKPGWRWNRRSTSDLLLHRVISRPPDVFHAALRGGVFISDF